MIIKRLFLLLLVAASISINKPLKASYEYSDDKDSSHSSHKTKHNEPTLLLSSLKASQDQKNNYSN